MMWRRWLVRCEAQTEEPERPLAENVNIVISRRPPWIYKKTTATPFLYPVTAAQHMALAVALLSGRLVCITNECTRHSHACTH